MHEEAEFASVNRYEFTSNHGCILEYACINVYYCIFPDLLYISVCELPYM